MPTIKFKESGFSIKNKAEFRDKPELDFIHRLKTRDHLEYITSQKLFDVADPRWAKATVDGKVYYAHEYQESILVVELKTSDGRFSLSHNDDGAFDRHLMDNPGENTVYSITSKNNGLESSQTFSSMSAGLSSTGILLAALAFTTSLASGVAAMEAAAYVASAFAATVGVELNVLVPGIGLALAVLAFIGIWIAYSVGREIMLNLVFENRSNKTITLVDHYAYNIGDNQLMPVALPPLQSFPPFEFYSDVVVNIDNYSKIRGIGIAMKFQKEDKTSCLICIRNDIYHVPHYTIATLAKDDNTSAQDAYNNCNGDLVTTDFKWGTDLVVKNRLDQKGFGSYNFSGIMAFNDVK